MKKLRFYLMPFLMVLLFAVGCGEDETSKDNTPEVIKPTLSFQVAEADITSVDLAADKDSEATIAVITNQEESTIEAVLDDAAKEWCDIYVSESTIQLVTYSENKTGKTRTATVSVTVGEGDLTKAETFTAIQDFNTDDATLAFNSDEVTFHDYAGQSDVVYITTNQSVINLSGLESSENFEATLDGKVITIETKGANEGSAPIVETLTVTVGEGDKTATEDIIITQLTPEAAKVYVEPSSVTFDGICAPEAVTIITNQATVSIATELTGTNADKFEVVVAKNIVTISAIEFNSSGADYEATLNITVGEGDNTAAESLVIKQVSQEAASISTSPEAVEFDNDIELDEAIAITTNQDASTITAELSGDNADKFDMVLDGTTVTVSTKELNLTADPFVATLTITAGEGLNKTTKEIAITQSNVIEFALSTTAAEISNTATSTTDVTVTTNMDYESISAALSGDDADKFTVEVADNVVTVSAIEVNMTGAAYAATLTIESSATTPAQSKTVAITQSAAISLTLSKTTVEMAGAIGSSAKFDIETNVASDNISVAVAEAYADKLSVALDGTTVTVTSLTEVAGAETVTFADAVVVTLCSGEVIETSKSVTVNQGVILEFGALYGGGIIFWVADDKQSFKIASLTEGSELSYSLIAGDPYNAAITSTDGAVNTAAMIAQAAELSMDFAEAYPAAAWCVALGEGWYSPSEEELKVLITYSTDADFQKVLTDGGYAPLIANDYYWSSNNVEDGSASKGVSIKLKVDGNRIMAGKFGKNGPRFSRAIKLITM